MQTQPQSTQKKVTTTWNGSWTNGLPNSYSDVVLEAEYDTGLNGSFSCNNLTINANLTIEADTQIKVIGSLVSQSSSAVFNIANKGEFILLHPTVDTSTVKLTVNFTIPHPLQRYDCWFLSSPISDVAIQNISPDTPLTSRFYEVACRTDRVIDEYWQIDSNRNTISGKGYYIRTPHGFSTAPSNWNITINNLAEGNINKGVINHTPSFTSDNDLIAKEYYIVGNPYLGNLDLRKFFERNREKIIDRIHILFSKNNGGPEWYVHLNPIESRSSRFSTEIRPFQAFGVTYKNPEDTDKTLVFTPDMQIIQKNFEHNYFNLEYKQNSANIPVGCCTYNADAFETSFNSYSDEKFLLAFRSNELNMVLHQGEPPYEGQIIDLYYKAKVTKDYTISLNGYGGSFNDFKIVLIDNELNTVTDLKDNSYTFAGVSGESSADRFKIQITK